MVTQVEIRGGARKALAEIAPEVDPAQRDVDKHFRDQFEFDSVDYLNF